MILIVDDNELVLVRLEQALKKAIKNLTLLRAQNCKTALEVLQSSDPDVIVLDISLPDGSGIDLLRTIKKDNPSKVVYMFTDFATNEFKKSCLELGADHFFEKSKLGSLIHSVQQLKTSMTKN